MIGLLMLFDLTTSPVTVEDLRPKVAGDSVPRWREMPGLRLKVFLSDSEAQAFGALYLWETEEALAAAIPYLEASSTQRLTGVVPSMRRFDVEAIVEGQHSTPDLSQVGRAMAAAAP